MVGVHISAYDETFFNQHPKPIDSVSRVLRPVPVNVHTRNSNLSPSKFSFHYNTLVPTVWERSIQGVLGKFLFHV